MVKVICRMGLGKELLEGESWLQTPFQSQTISQITCTPILDLEWVGFIS